MGKNCKKKKKEKLNGWSTITHHPHQPCLEDHTIGSYASATEFHLPNILESTFALSKSRPDTVLMQCHHRYGLKKGHLWTWMPIICFPPPRGEKKNLPFMIWRCSSSVSIRICFHSNASVTCHFEQLEQLIVGLL